VEKTGEETRLSDRIGVGAERLSRRVAAMSGGQPGRGVQRGALCPDRGAPDRHLGQPKVGDLPEYGVMRCLGVKDRGRIAQTGPG
jgi:hypothetical protein